MGINRYSWRTLGRELMMLAAAALVLLPFYLLITLSLKTNEDVFIRPLTFPSDPQLANYADAWTAVPSGVGLDRALLNSLIITVGSVVCVIVLGSIAAYVLARWKSRLSTAIYFIFVIAIVLPPQLALVPLYVALRSIGQASTYFGMILLWTALLMPLAVFLYTGFIRALPRDYEEAAQVDGASFFRTWLRVVFPLLRPVTGTVAVLTGLLVWNDLFAPLVFLSGSENATVPVTVFALANQFVTQWNLVFAAVAIALTPVLGFFLVAQRQLIRGFTGGIRG